MRRLGAAAFGLSFLWGCAAPRVESDGRLMAQWRFAAPPGWTTRDGRIWSSPSHTTLLSFQLLPASRPRDLRAILDPYFTHYSPIRLCRGLPALLGEERPPFGTSVADEVATQQPGSIAIATYRYGRGSVPDPAAERSIRSLCPTRR